MSSNSVKRFFIRHCKGRSSLFKLLINFCIVAICGLFLITQLYKHSGETNEVFQESKTEALVQRRPIVLPILPANEFHYVEPANSFFKQKHNVLMTKVDWHNWTHIAEEKSRKGPGEQGIGFRLSDPEDIRKNNELNRVNGYWAVASDLISVNRSVKDIRHSLCQKKNYLKELPTASVVIPFFNDHLSVLMRTVHSVINRAPAHLLKEVILVNDCSDKVELHGELEEYLKNNFEGKAHVIHLPQREGLIVARIVGARQATADVLIFLDSHTEANINWLPPLLDPIAEDYRTCVCPFIDVIDAQDYAYRAQDEGNRGAFEWNFLYKRIEIRPQDQETPADNFPSPVMAGGLFAMSSKFFWEVGGYDPGLDIWGGEQYELSFKIWLCGGQMVDSPCSRIGHIYKHNPFPSARKGDYLTKNFKRVAEVWMDEYKDALYRRKPDRFAGIDPGDITEQLAVKERLKCKSFRYFLEVVAPDMLEKYPPYQTEFAIGTIESLAHPGKCLDSLGHFFREVGLYSCSHNRASPHGSQFFFLGHNRDIEYYTDSAYCLQMSGSKIEVGTCHHQQGSQYFHYDLDSQQMKVGSNEKNCLEADEANSKILVKACDKNESKQKWTWGKLFEDNLKNWDKVGAKKLG